MTIVMSLETSAVQLIGWVPVSNLLNQSLWSSYDHHRHAINFQEQGNGCHLIKMMSTMGYLFFFSEANVRLIWYLFVAFACRNWEFFYHLLFGLLFFCKNSLFDMILKFWSPEPIIKIYVVYVTEIWRPSMQNGLYLIWKTIIILFFYR